MMTVSEFMKAIGRNNVAALGISQQAISRAITEDVMPSGWYLAVRALCEEAGVEVPEHLFRWFDRRAASRAPSVGA